MFNQNFIIVQFRFGIFTAFCVWLCDSSVLSIFKMFVSWNRTQLLDFPDNVAWSTVCRCFHLLQSENPAVIPPTFLSFVPVHICTSFYILSACLFAVRSPAGNVYYSLQVLHQLPEKLDCQDLRSGPLYAALRLCTQTAELCSCQQSCVFLISKFPLYSDFVTRSKNLF